jgi:hypothetical protein
VSYPIRYASIGGCSFTLAHSKCLVHMNPNSFNLLFRISRNFTESAICNMTNQNKPEKTPSWVVSLFHSEMLSKVPFTWTKVAFLFLVRFLLCRASLIVSRAHELKSSSQAFASIWKQLLPKLFNTFNVKKFFLCLAP